MADLEHIVANNFLKFLKNELKFENDKRACQIAENNNQNTTAVSIDSADSKKIIDFASVFEKIVKTKRLIDEKADPESILKYKLEKAKLNPPSSEKKEEGGVIIIPPAESQ